MATTIQVFNPAANLPAFAKKGELSAMAKALVGSAASGKRVSVKGGVFRLISNGKEVAAIDERYLDVVFINAAPHISRTFYIGVFDENKVMAPMCWSAAGDVPSPDAKDKQSDNCASCPQNIKGSGTGESRACRYSQRVALVLANDMEGDVMQLSLAATSLFGKAEGENRPMQEYARYLTAQGIDPAMLVTRMRFDTTAAVPKLFFKAMRWLTEEEFASTSAKANEPDAINAITMTVSQQDGVADEVEPPAPMPKPKPAAKPKPAPVVEPEEEEEAPPPPPKAKALPKKTAPAPIPDDEPAPEPKVAKKAAAPAAPVASSLADTLAAWDDDDN